MDKKTMHAAHNECPLCGATKVAHRLVCVDCAPGLYHLEEQDQNRVELTQIINACNSRSSTLPSVVSAAGLLVFCLGLITSQVWRWPDQMVAAAPPTRVALISAPLSRTNPGFPPSGVAAPLDNATK